MIKVIIADDHPIVRKGLKEILAEDPNIRVVDEAGDGHELLRKVRGGDFDMIILDISMPGLDGLDVLKQIKTERSGARVLMLTIHPEARYAVRCLKMGADGYLTKGSAPDELMLAIQRISGGRKYISQNLAEALTDELKSGSDRTPHETLSDREYQVMIRIASGKSLKGIAEELALSVKTVSTYRSRILEKLRLQNNADLTLYAFHHNLIE
jgi:two-component system, NarL family, invasion response regulator UvrY